jgi:hypothetical protein
MATRTVVKRRQSLRGHGRPEIGAANADIDDVGEWPARGADQRALPDRIAKRGHARQNRVHASHNVLALGAERCRARRAQGDMQHGPILGGVDFLAGKHRRAPLFDPGRAGKLGELAHDGVVDCGLGPVDEEIVEAQRKRLEAVRIGSKRGSDVEGNRRLARGVQRGKRAVESIAVHGVVLSRPP